MKYVKTFESYSSDDSINEGFKLSNVVETAKNIAKKLVPTLTAEDKKTVQEIGKKLTNKFGDPKEIIDNLSGVKDLTKQEEMALTKESFSFSFESDDEIFEGLISDSVKKWAGRFAATIAAPVSFVSGIIGMAATGYNTWGDSAFLARVHDMVDAAVGKGGGPLSFLVFALTFVFLFWGVANWNKGTQKA
jgi:hypothetical protein